MPEEILNSSSVELNTEKEVVKEEIKTEEKTPVENEPKETIAELETLAEKTDDAVPLKKYMAEKNAKREADAKIKELQSELARMRQAPSETDNKVDLKSLSEKHNIDEEVLRDILNASYTMSKEKIKQELESEINPKLAEFETIKKEKQRQDFESKFDNHLSMVLKEMPEFTNLVDKEDLKAWIKSGQYSKLTLPQLIESKYGKFISGKKTIEPGYTPSRESDIPDVKNMSDEDYKRLETDPDFKKKWAEGLEERIRKFM